MDYNPYKLKTHDVDWTEGEKAPTGYLDSSSFLSFLNRRGVKIEREDNLPRWANNNDVKMIKCTRDGKFGSVPTYYFPPSDTRMKEIVDNQKNVNNSLIGRAILKKKEQAILSIFDAAKDNSVSRTSLAEDVAEKLGVSCNRKFVKKVLDEKRSKSQLEKKLSKIS